MRPSLDGFFAYSHPVSRTEDAPLHDDRELPGV